MVRSPSSSSSLLRRSSLATNKRDWPCSTMPTTGRGGTPERPGPHRVSGHPFVFVFVLPIKKVRRFATTGRVAVARRQRFSSARRECAKESRGCRSNDSGTQAKNQSPRASGTSLLLNTIFFNHAYSQQNSCARVQSGKMQIGYFFFQ